MFSLTKIIQRQGILELWKPSSTVFLRTESVFQAELQKGTEYRLCLHCHNPTIKTVVEASIGSGGRGFLILDKWHYTKSNYVLTESVTGPPMRFGLDEIVKTVTRYRKCHIYSVAELILKGTSGKRIHDFYWVSESESETYFKGVENLHEDT